MLIADEVDRNVWQNSLKAQKKTFFRLLVSNGATWDYVDIDFLSHLTCNPLFFFSNSGITQKTNTDCLITFSGNYHKQYFSHTLPFLVVISLLKRKSWKWVEDCLPLLRKSNYLPGDWLYASRLISHVMTTLQLVNEDWYRMNAKYSMELNEL